MASNNNNEIVANKIEENRNHTLTLIKHSDLTASEIEKMFSKFLKEKEEEKLEEERQKKREALANKQ